MASAMLPLGLALVVALSVVRATYHGVALEYHMSGECEVGQMFIVSGTTSPNATFLTVNLAGESTFVHVFFQMDVLFNDGVIYRYDSDNGEWNYELNANLINATESHNPLVAGQPFTVSIFVGQVDYLLAINGRPYCTYKHLKPLAQIRMLAVGSDWPMAVHQIEHRTASPVAWPPRQLDAVDAKRWDFVHTVPRPYRAGHRITITGIPMSSAAAGQDRGRFDLLLDEHGDGDVDVISRNVLRFVAVFGGSAAEPNGGHVAISSSQSAAREWLDAERHADGATSTTGAFPFAVGRQFMLTIVMEAADEFEFRVADQPIARYKFQHAVRFERLSELRIEGRDGMRLNVTEVRHTHQ